MSRFRSRKGDRKRTQKDPEIMHLLAEEQQLYARGNLRAGLRRVRLGKPAKHEADHRDVNDCFATAW